MGRSAGVHRPWHAGRDTLGEPGRPQRLLTEESLGVRYTANEAHKGKPGDGTRLESSVPSHLKVDSLDKL